MKNYRHIIWDWNGTLLNDSAACICILNTLLKRRNMPRVRISEYRRQFGFPVKDYYELIGFDFSTESYNDVADEFIAIYDDRRFECELQDHARDVLVGLKECGITHSILSAYHQDSLREIVRHFRLQDYFEHLFGLDDFHAAGKVDLARRLLDKLPFDPDELLIVGDTIHDWEVACEVGVDCVLFPGGHQSRERLESCGVVVVDSLLGIPDVIGR